MIPTNFSAARPGETPTASPSPDVPSAAAPVPAPVPGVSAPPASRARGRSARLTAALLAVALAGGMIGVAADRSLVLNGRAGGAPLAAAASPTAASVPRVGPLAAQNGPATDPQQQGIQQAIQHADEEQAQAFASSDPSVMADTSTADFLQQQISTNQDLRANGIAAIKVVTIDWGDISISGTQATATAWETWSTTYSDGTTEQSRDRNVYTLTQDNGAWKIAADEHPDDALAAAGGGSTAPRRVAPTQPRQPAQPTQPGQPGLGTQPGAPRGQRGPAGDVSQNWSGYAATGGTFTAVNGTWTVPQFTPDSGAGADATWVGIGGVTSRDLLQAGTQQTVSGNGSTQYEAWVETLPQASHPVPLTVNPGDSVSIAITQQPQAPDEWLVAFNNNTTGQTFQVTEHYASSLSSAEWIEEAPSAARGRQLPLDNFGTVAFTSGATVKNGQTVTIADSGAKAITMIARGGQPLATPSNLGADGATFSITRNL